jgi:hypothetical protein
VDAVVVEEAESGAVAGALVVDGEDADDEALVVVVAPDSGGRVELVFPPASVEAADPPPAKMLPINMPKTDATPIAVASCQVRHDLRSLIPN